LDIANIQSVEETVISNLTTFVLRLNENMFKPFFLKSLDWASKTSEEDQNGERDINRVNFFLSNGRSFHKPIKINLCSLLWLYDR